LKATLDVNELVKLSGSLNFSWDDHKNGIKYFLTKLDHAYVACTHSLINELNINKISFGEMLMEDLTTIWCTMEYKYVVCNLRNPIEKR
jgi:hypothetical protein